VADDVFRLIAAERRTTADFLDTLDERQWATSSLCGTSLVATLRDNAEHRFTPPTLGPEAPLTDIVVHTLDMRLPLGAGADLRRPEAINTVLAFLVTPAASRGFVAKGRTAGLAFTSSDTGWSHGGGPAVRGPGSSMALAITGRPAGLEGLEGAGVAELARRIAR
jgi:hypothetical protein